LEATGRSLSCENMQRMDNQRHRSTAARSALSLAGALLLLAVAGPAGAAEHQPSRTPQEVFDAMRPAFVPAKARGVHATYQWHLKNPDGGDWFVTVTDGHFEMGRGTIPNPNVVFICTGRDWVRLSNGTLSGVWAYLTGRLKVRGSHQLARKLDEMFP